MSEYINHFPEAEADSLEQKEWVHLTKVANDIEYQMVAGLLKLAQIPSISKVKGIDGFMQVVIGVPIGGIDVMVPQERYEEAYALITAPVDETELLLEEEESEKESGSEDK